MYVCYKYNRNTVGNCAQQGRNKADSIKTTSHRPTRNTQLTQLRHYRRRHRHQQQQPKRSRNATQPPTDLTQLRQHNAVALTAPQQRGQFTERAGSVEAKYKYFSHTHKHTWWCRWVRRPASIFTVNLNTITTTTANKTVTSLTSAPRCFAAEWGRRANGGVGETKQAKYVFMYVECWLLAIDY